MIRPSKNRMKKVKPMYRRATILARNISIAVLTPKAGSPIGIKLATEVVALQFRIVA
jgi:hypothetical protein